MTTGRHPWQAALAASTVGCGDEAPAAGSLTRLPAAVIKQGTPLLNQQFWLWGRDVRRPEGNLLCQLGFRQCPPPPACRVPSRYDLTLPSGEQISLWGFGLRYQPAAAVDVGVFLQRQRFGPRLTGPLPALWDPVLLPPLPRPATDADWSAALVLTAAALRWIAGYERAILARTTPEYRPDCLAAWRRPVGTAGSRPVGTAGSLPVRWQRLAACLDASAARLRAQVGKQAPATSLNPHGAGTPSSMQPA